jgi:fibronectin-binding autotransporter adhesin
MNRISAILASAILASVAAPAATFNTVLTVNAKAALSGTSFAITGTAAFTGGIGSGSIASTISLTSIDATGKNAVADYTITLTGGGTLTGKLTVPVTLLTAGAVPSATVSITVTGGTGTYAGATSGSTAVNLTGSITGDIVSGYSLNNFTSGSFTITTGGGGGGPTGPPAPSITAVLDAASNTANVAPGGIFIVKGSNLCPSGTNFFNVPRPTTAPDGVKITFTPSTGGSGTDAILIYEYNPSGTCQLAGIVPSSVAAGTYNVVVTNGTASTPFSAKVIAQKPALFTQDSSGTGLGTVQNYISQAQVDLNRFTTGSVSGTSISPAKPGQFLIAYGTGLGAFAGGDNVASPVHDFSTDSGVTIKAIVGGMTLPVAFAGRAGYAGEDQINFALPSNIATGCTVSFQISVNGVLSNPTFIAIAPDANSANCVQPGYTSDQLKKFDNGGTITTGSFLITQFGITVPQVGAVKSNTIGGGFVQLTGYQLASGGQANVSVIQSGSCQIYTATSTGTTSGGGTLTYLDAGAVSITGPSGSGLTNQALTKTNNSYSLSAFEGSPIPIPGTTNFTLPAGTYTLNGGGGPDVGTFSASLNLASALTVTGGLPSTVNRGSNLVLNWTGGNASDLVEIVGSASTTSGSGSTATTTSTQFICLTTAGQKTFTVPSSILSQLPATSATSPGLLEVASGNLTSTFTATLPKLGGSIDAGLFGSFAGTGAQVAYQ